MPSFAFSISRFSKNLLHLLFPLGLRRRTSRVLRVQGEVALDRALCNPVLFLTAIQIVCSGLAVHGETISVDSRALAGSLSRA